MVECIYEVILSLAIKSVMKYTENGVIVFKPSPILRTSSTATRILMEAEPGVCEVRIK